MKTLRAAIVWVAAGLFLMSLILELSVHVANARTRQKSEALLKAIRQLRPGESTLSSTEKLPAEFGAMRFNPSPVVGSPPETMYQIDVVCNIDTLVCGGLASDSNPRPSKQICDTKAGF